MLLVAPPVLGFLIGLLAGGDAGNWGRVRVRWAWFIIAAVVVRIVTDFKPLSSVGAVRYLYMLFLLALLGWTLLQLGTLPGIWLVSAGSALNLIVILSNAGHMPVSAMSGYAPGAGGGLYVAADSTTRLSWLGDWIGLPGWLGGAASPGDVVIGLGIGVVAFLITRRSGSPTKLDATKTGIGSYPP